jgi:DNA-directed RNA polymerase specialized sigma24 family protein
MPLSPSPPSPGNHDPTPPPTLAFLDAWKAGDEQAFVALHTRFSPLLRRRIARHQSWTSLKNHWQLEDALQQLWRNALPALRTKFQHNGPGSLEAYLGRISDDTVTSLLREHLAQKRGRGGAKPLPTDFETATPKPGATAPESPTGHARASELRRIAGEVCSERELEIWELLELQGYTSEEVALATGDTAEAVRGVKHRAKAKISARLHRSGEDFG